MYKSNASLSKDAANATLLASDATKTAKDNDLSSQEAASQAHHSAAYKQQDAGNATQAAKHRGIAEVHSEKAQTLRTQKYHADSMGSAAEAIGKKAELSHFGKGDDKDPRGHDELHADAATAHEKASKAYENAGDDRQASYHADQAKKHQTCAFSADSASAAE